MNGELKASVAKVGVIVSASAIIGTGALIINHLMADGHRTTLARLDELNTKQNVAIIATTKVSDSLLAVIRVQEGQVALMEQLEKRQDRMASRIAKETTAADKP